MSNSTVHLLHKVGQVADQLLSEKLAAADLTARQLIVLKAIHNREFASQTDVVEDTGVDRSTTADIVRRLVARGLLVRERTEWDQRMYAVRLTAAGEQLLATALPKESECASRLLDAVPTRDRDVFVRALNSIVDEFGPISSARVPVRNRRAAAE